MEFGKEYIKTFETEAQYTAFKASSGYNEPNVSYISGDNLVHYNKYVDPYAGHSYVDFGLPSGTKWATMNIGASSETDYGNYYQYGKGSAQYAATSGDSDYNGTENPLAASADTAAQVWGGGWHIPTSAQCQELLDNCTWTWTTSGGTNGYSASKNGKSIFFPAGDRWVDGSQQSAVGSRGYYWSSSPSMSNNCYDMAFFSDGLPDLDSWGLRKNGLSVRGVVG